ncbi:MAG: ATPase, partial [Bacteroidales bacterium]|nr:ATPase [Bacteroidales bacterium]
NKDDRMEIDFLIAKSTITSRHNISPIEVKSSTGFSTVSMEKCLKKYSTHLSQAYIVHTGDVEWDEDYLYIPLYMVPCL